ncbi:hypothetical protein OG21DRAFT_1267462 [Imleria badia]|nr:hypothetical protein OG21DRAFT_1267462 [Imleria badia]
MILRVYAMYNKSRIVLGVLLALCAATIILVAISTAFYNNPDTYLTMTNPQVLNVSFCDPIYTTTSKLGRYKLIPRLILAALMFILVVVRLCMESFQMYKVTNQWKANETLNHLVRKGVVYFLVHLLNNINMGDGTAGSVMTMLIFILMFILSPRFIINVRELHSRKLVHGNGWNKGIDTGFGMWDNQSPRVLAVPWLGFADLRTSGVSEGDVEMLGVDS